MARPVLITNDAILAAARAVFMEHGIRATTAAVAQRAGVSEGVLFKRFGSKVELLRAAVTCTLSPGELLPMAPHTAFTEESFQRFTLAMLNHLRLVVPMALMTWAHLSADESAVEPGTQPMPTHWSGQEPPPVRVVREIAQVFEQQIELGAFKPGNARVLARIFCGTLWQTAFLECVLRDHAMAIAPPNFIEEFTTMLFHGVKTPDPTRLSE